MDRLLKEALNEALQVKARAGFRLVPSLFTTVKSSAEDIIAAFSKAARFCMAKWMHLKMPAGILLLSTGSAA